MDTGCVADSGVGDSGGRAGASVGVMLWHDEGRQPCVVSCDPRSSGMPCLASCPETAGHLVYALLVIYASNARSHVCLASLQTEVPHESPRPMPWGMGQLGGYPPAIAERPQKVC